MADLIFIFKHLFYLWTYPATRRWPLRQVYPPSWSVWTSESGKAEEEMD